MAIAALFTTAKIGKQLRSRVGRGGKEEDAVYAHEGTLVSHETVGSLTTGDNAGGPAGYYAQ